MVKVVDLKVEEQTTKGRKIRVNLIADESVEVEDLGTSGVGVIGLNDDDTMTMGSTCFTATMEFGVLDSTGNWRFQ